MPGAPSCLVEVTLFALCVVRRILWAATHISIKMLCTFGFERWACTGWTCMAGGVTGGGRAQGCMCVSSALPSGGWSLLCWPQPHSCFPATKLG